MREIGRLRLKFIIYNMLVVTAVIGITFCAVTSVVTVSYTHLDVYKRQLLQRESSSKDGLRTVRLY